MKRTIKDLFDLTKKVAIVTGGAGEQFGSQITESLAEAGATVIITSRNKKKAYNRARICQQNNLKVYGFQLDLTSEKKISIFIKKIKKKYGRIDILVNNAATLKMGSFENISKKDWDKVIAINMTAPLFLSREVGKIMKKRKSGNIINISTIYGVVSPDHSIYEKTRLNSPLIYGATKAGLIQMTKYWAAYWGPYNIRINSVSPGGMFNNQPNIFLKNYIKKTPLGRMANENDLKGIISFLASDASAFVTGQNFIIDGGLTVI